MKYEVQLPTVSDLKTAYWKRTEELVSEPESISVPVPGTVSESDELALSFEFKIHIVAKVKPSSPIRQPTVKVGEDVPPLWHNLRLSLQPSESIVQQIDTLANL